MGNDVPHDEGHMTDLEALMWNLEKDPRLSSNVANISFLDRSIDFEHFTATMERASLAFPRLRERVAPAFGRLAPPRWEVDPNFDISYHVRRISLGGRGSHREALDYATSLYCAPLDRTRPLWEFVVIDGLRNGRSAMVQRLHHTVTDGEGGLNLSLEFIDFSRHPKQRTPVTADSGPHETKDFLGSVLDSVSHLGRRQLGVARRNLESAAHLAVHPTEIIEAGQQATHLTKSLIGQASVSPHPLSPIWTERSLSRHFETISIPFDTAKRAARRLGGTLNDLFVTGATHAASAYHSEFGSPTDSLRMAMPISHRSNKGLGGNLFAPIQVVVPSAPMPIGERFVAIHQLLGTAKSDPAVTAASAVAGVVNWLPTSVLTRTGFRFASTIDFVTSNLKAAPFEVFISGAKMESNFPMGPLAGSAFNITTISYNGSFGMGVVIDTSAIAHPEVLIAELKSSYAQLLKSSSGAQR